MNELVYGVWEGKVIDPANGGATLLSQIEKLGEYEPGNPIRALMGWDGFLLFAEPRGQGGGEGVDLVDMARAYMAMTQGEACGKCVPGRMGTHVAADISGPDRGRPGRRGRYPDPAERGRAGAGRLDVRAVPHVDERRPGDA